MADEKLSQRPSATSVSGSDLLYVVQGSSSRKATASQLPISTATQAALDGKEAAGAAAAAITAHQAAADPHPGYLTPAEADAAYVAIGAPAPTLVAVRNNSGVSLAAGTPVIITGSSGTRPTVAAADASVEATAAQTLGLMAATAANNSDGVVITQGILSGINTAALTEGGIVWLSETTGQLTSARPTQPAHGVFLGLCVKQGAGSSGILYVNVINGQELEELHDVLIVSPAAGQALVYGSDGLWRNTTLTAGLDAYVHTQVTPATTWTISHNLGRYPSVELFNSGMQEIDAEIAHPSTNQTVVTLNPATAGLARLI